MAPIRTAALAALLLALPLHAQHDHGGAAPGHVPGLGAVTFANSGAPAAQPAFIRGLALLHNFHYPEAAEAFKQAQAADPGFAMAYWGEAMTYNHAIWLVQDSVAARAALARLGASPEARLARAPTEREKDYLRAIHVLYGAGRKEARDSAYARAMEGVAARHPNDPEAKLFHSLSLLALPRVTETYMRAASIAESVLRQHPRHPGALHYTIHAYDHPAHASKGLNAAREYAKVSPDAGHAQHMTSHIFIALGMWDDVVSANETAIRSPLLPRDAQGRPLPQCGHAPTWLQYAYLQTGRLGEARRMMEACHAAAGAGSGGAALGFAEMRLRWLLDVERPNDDVVAMRAPLETRPAGRFMYDFGSAYAALARGDTATARPLIEGLAAARQAWSASPMGAVYRTREGAMRVGEQELRGLMLLRQGRTDDAVAALRRAAALEDSLPFEFGPPAVEKPSHELLGEVLLQLGRHAEARAEFEAALARAPLRPRSLAGLARAAEASGDAAKAAELRSTLRRIAHRADAGLATTP